MSDEQDGVWAGECFFWYQPTQVVPEKGLLNGCVCVLVMCQKVNINEAMLLHQESIKLFIHHGSSTCWIHTIKQ